MSVEDFAEIEDVTEGLENRIFNAVRESTGIDEIYEHIKTKRYTLSRIRRIIIKSYLGITKEYSKDVPYIRILGFNDKGKNLGFKNPLPCGTEQRSQIIIKNQ